jgi:HEAT repeat protein
MNDKGRIYRVLVVLTTLAMLASCVPVPSNSAVTSGTSSTEPLSKTAGTPRVADLLAQLADQDAGVRLHAAYQLGELWPMDEGAVEALIQAAGDTDPQVRTVASYALGKAQTASDQAVSALEDRLKDDSPQVRYSSARALGNLGAAAKSALPELLRLLKEDADENVRYAAAEAIGTIGPTLEARPVLMQALKDDNWYVRHYAGLALKSLSAGALLTSDEFQGTDWDLRSAIADLLSQVGPDEIQALVSALVSDNETDPYRQRLITVDLIRLAPESTSLVAAELAKAISNNDQMSIDRMLKVLTATGKRAVPALAAVVKSESQFSNTVADALGGIGSDAIPALVEMLPGANDPVASRATTALGWAGQASSAAAAAVSLDVSTAEDRQAALASLREIDQRQNEAVLALRALLQQGPAALRGPAIDSLAKFGSAGQSATPELVQLLADAGQDQGVRRAAARALGSVGDGSPVAYAALMAAAQDQGSVALRKEAITALGGMSASAVNAAHALVEIIKDPNVSQDVSRAAIEAIGKLGPAAQPAVPELAEILKSGPTSNRKAAAQALGGLGPAAVSDLIMALRGEQEPSVRNATATSLAKIGPPAVPALIAVLSEDNQDAAAGARTALSTKKDGSAVPGLIVALSTADKPMRAEILNILNKIGAHAFAGFEILLQDGDPEIQSQAIVFATEVYTKTYIGLASGLAVEEAVPFLTSEVVTGDQETRAEALDALAMIGPSAVSAAPALVGALRDTDQEIRLNAARALAAIGPRATAAAPALVAALQSETDPAARRAMLEALAVTGLNGADGTPALLKALREPALRRAAAEALGHAGAASAPALLAAISESAPAAVPEVAEALRGRNNDLRRAAAYALLLNTTAAKRVAGDLAAVVGDEGEDTFVRSMAAAALERSGQDAGSFWDAQGMDSPLVKTCPPGKKVLLSGGSSFDIYDDGCHYEPPPGAAPPWKVLRALVRRLTGR